jgi:hypothetical protein
LAPRVGIEPTTNGLTERMKGSRRYRIARNQKDRLILQRQNPVQYTPVQFSGKQLGNKQPR